MNSNNNMAKAPPTNAEAPPCNFRNRGLTFSTLVIALAGFAGTALSSAPIDAGVQPLGCIGSILH